MIYIQVYSNVLCMGNSYWYLELRLPALMKHELSNRSHLKFKSEYHWWIDCLLFKVLFKNFWPMLGGYSLWAERHSLSCCFCCDMESQFVLMKRNTPFNFLFWQSKGYCTPIITQIPIDKCSHWVYSLYYIQVKWSRILVHYINSSHVHVVIVWNYFKVFFFSINPNI